MPAVSKAQQRFMGMVHATQKGDMEAPSKEVEKVADTMKKVDAKDFASTKHKGLPTHVKERLKEIIRGVLRAEGAFGSVIGGPEDGRNLTEMSPNDTHFKGIMAMYDKGGSFAKKKVGAAVSKNPNASRNQIIDDLKDLDYHEILDAEAQLGLDETIMEEFKHVIHVDTPTQVVSKPIAAQIEKLARQGVRSKEIGLKMGFVGNQKAATDAFQKVKNKIYFELGKKNESVEEATTSSAPGEWVAYLSMTRGKKLLKTFDTARGAKQFLSKNVDKLLGAANVESVGIMTKKQWDVGEAKYAVESINEGKLGDDWRKNNKKGYVLKVGNIELKAAGPTNTHDIYKNGYLWGTFSMDYEAGGTDWWVKPGKGNDFWVDTIEDLVKKVKADKRFNESISEAKYPTDLKIGSVVMGQGFTRLKGIDGGKYYKIVDMDDATATLVPSDKSGNVKSSSKVRHKLDSIEGGIKTAKRGDENGIVVIKESKEHNCGCNENHDCGCGGVHEHIHEDLSADANGIAGLTASRASAVEDFLEKNNINSNKLYLFLKKGNLKDRMDFVTALVGKPGNPIQKKVISQFSK
jgi:hypothetical protein